MTEREALEKLLLHEGLALKSALHRCLVEIVGNDDVSAFFASLSEGGQRKQSVCGAVWKRGSFAYRCLDCEIDPKSYVCADCFQGGSHQGHDYRIVQSGPGCCDCGLPTAWKTSGFCKHHGVSFSPDGKPLYLPYMKPELKAKLTVLLEVVCARMRIEVLL